MSPPLFFVRQRSAPTLSNCGSIIMSPTHLMSAVALLTIGCDAFLFASTTRSGSLSSEISSRRPGFCLSNPGGQPRLRQPQRDVGWELAGNSAGAEREAAGWRRTRKPHTTAKGTQAARASPDIADESGSYGGDINLSSAMANARANLAAGTAPGAGLESAFDQADAAFADLIVTSVDSQGVELDDEDVQELAKGGSMDESSTSRKSKGFFGDMSDILGALSGGAHIVKREDGTV